MDIFDRRNEENALPTLSLLERGDCFEIGGEFYQKTDSVREDREEFQDRSPCVFFENGQIIYIPNNQKVKRVNIQIHIMG